jgi:phospholipid-binding lipoprotein MlaA
MRHARGGVNWAVASALPLLLTACAGVPRDASLPINDPNEQLNRHVLTATRVTLRPAAEVVSAIPGPLHDRLRDLNSNLKEPRIFVNNVLQGRFDAAHATAGRFLANSVLGAGGLFDIASRAGLEQRSGDFGQTLFVWGVAEGPYVMRPYLGPSTLRDAVGSAVDMVADPVGWAIGSQVALSVGTSILEAAEKLGQLKQAEDASIDFYSFVRSAYYQTRRAELREAIGLPSAIDSPALDDPEAASNARAQSSPAAMRLSAAPKRPLRQTKRQDERRSAEEHAGQ